MATEEAPRVGEEVDLDLTGARSGAEGVYVVLAVRYHVRPRTFTRDGDLFGVRITLRPLG